MFQTGMFTGYFPCGFQKAAQRIRSHGFNTVQLDLHFKDIDLGFGQNTKAKTVRDTFRDQNLLICCISGYTNIIRPGLAHRNANMDWLKEVIRTACNFGTPCVISKSAPTTPRENG